MERFPRFLCLPSYDPLFLLSPEITRNSTALFCYGDSGQSHSPTLAYGNPSPTFSTISGSSLLPPVAMFEGTIVIDLVTVSVLALLVMALLAFWIYHVQCRKNKVYIVLEIGDYTDCVRIRCVSLTSVLYAYKFSATNYIESLRTSGFCPGYLSIQWPTFKGTHIKRDKFLPFPSKVKIYPWTKRRIRKILRNPDLYVIPLVEFHDSFRLLDLSEEDILRESDADNYLGGTINPGGTSSKRSRAFTWFSLNDSIVVAFNTYPVNVSGLATLYGTLLRLYDA